MGEIELYYDMKSEGYDENFDMLYFKVFDEITWRYVEPYVPTDPDALVLDAGGGTGRWAIRIGRKGCRVILMDVSKGMLEVAANKVKEENLQHRILIREGDITTTGFRDETFDMILCEHTLFLFKEPSILIKELKRVLKRKSRLIISGHNRYVQSLVSLPKTPSATDVEEALDILLCKKHCAMNGNGRIRIYTWTPKEFRRMLETNGFQVEKIVGKCSTMPLRISKELFMEKEYSEALFKRILEFELALCEREDALALSGTLQAIVSKP